MIDQLMVSLQACIQDVTANDEKKKRLMVRGIAKHIIREIDICETRYKQRQGHIPNDATLEEARNRLSSLIYKYDDLDD